MLGKRLEEMLEEEGQNVFSIVTDEIKQRQSKKSDQIFYTNST